MMKAPVKCKSRTLGAGTRAALKLFGTLLVAAGGGGAGWLDWEGEDLCPQPHWVCWSLFLPSRPRPVVAELSANRGIWLPVMERKERDWNSANKPRGFFLLVA